ncbi:EDD domain protein, DegV family [Longilinea arvoryzae]|uniref:EDD domain protein, DegV family n=1 Tax=Longilinea arvoryzae TaxID=360412 RepID=A0A0S7BA46_9CHLR|nr:DegV family protein [Longilinea arvoryzae]GAP14444.1 EDD domain protein, DegV family [Longilinea arvoryzae]
MLRIVTDGSADIPAGWQKEYQIDIMPLRVCFGGKMYTQGVDLTGDDFYRLIDERHEIPKTSLPSPDQVIDFYRSVARRGEMILSIHVASKLSGTFDSFQLAARELVNEYKIYLIDSGAGSAGLAFMCREARQMWQSGLPIEKILARMNAARNRLAISFTVNSLEFAHMSGRINALQNAVSSLLNIKPIIVLRDGLLEMTEKVRTRHRSLDRIIEVVQERIGQQMVDLAVVHAADPEMAKEMLEKARRAFNVRDFILTDLSLPVACHLGPGTIGIVAYPVGKEE